MKKLLMYKVPVYLILVGYIAMVACLVVIQYFASSSQPCQHPYSEVPQVEAP